MLPGALLTAVAAWFSQGVLAFTHAGGPRIALLPLSAGALALVVTAAAGVLLLGRAGASTAPSFLLVFLLLPWIPGGVPAAFLLWLGPLTLLIWAAVACAMVASAFKARGRPLDLFRGRQALAAGALAFIVYAISAWQVSPSVPGGDEPHYLVITQSLLKDGDLRIENNHRRGDYQAYYTGTLQPDFRRRGRDGQIYSIHAPGVSAFVAPAFAAGGYAATVAFLLIVSAAGSALAWQLAWIATARADAAWFGWAAVTFAATSIFHSFTVYPDGPGGVLVLTGVWGLLRAERERQTNASSVRPWLLHGIALAALPWFHTRFAVLAGTLGAVIVLRLAATRNAAAKATAFLGLPALSAVCWIGYFVAVYGTADPSAPYAGEAGSLAFVPGAVIGLLFDQRFGLLAYAPVVAAAFVGLGMMIVRGSHARLALEMLFVIVPYVLTVTHFAMWWGGWSAPARFAAPVLPMLAIPAAIFWTAVRHPVTRTTALAALAVTVFSSAVLVFADGGRLAYNSIVEPAALWLPRVNSVAEIAAGLPLWSRTADVPLFRDAAVWVLALGLAWAVLRWGIASSTPALARRQAATATATLAVYTIATMAALTLVWRFRGANGIAVASAQVELLRHVSLSPRVFALDLNRLTPVSRDNIPGRLRIELTRELPARGDSRDVARAGSRTDRPLFAVSALPAGEYLVTPMVTEPRGWIMLGVGRDQFALRTEPLASVLGGMELQLAANVFDLVVRGDEDARQVIRGLRVEPLSLLPGSMRATDAFARRAVKYGGTTVFFFDAGSFAEPEAFWVAGATSTAVAVQPAARTGALELYLRNAPRENRVRVQSGEWRDELQLAPGEERSIRVPLDRTRDATLLQLSSSAGFTPSALDPNSRDNRYLGVWVKVE